VLGSARRPDQPWWKCFLESNRTTWSAGRAGNSNQPNVKPGRLARRLGIRVFPREPRWLRLTTDPQRGARADGGLEPGPRCLAGARQQRTHRFRRPLRPARLGRANQVLVCWIIAHGLAGPPAAFLEGTALSRRHAANAARLRRGSMPTRLVAGGDGWPPVNGILRPRHPAAPVGWAQCPGRRWGARASRGGAMAAAIGPMPWPSWDPDASAAESAPAPRPLLRAEIKKKF